MDSQKLNNSQDNFQPAQLIWGVALMLMGIGFFFRIPHVLSRVSGGDQTLTGQLFIRFCLYMIAIILFGGGIKKTVNVLKGYRKGKDRKE